VAGTDPIPIFYPLADPTSDLYDSAMSTIGTDGLRASIATHKPASGLEVAAWTAVVVVVTLLPFGFPGAGIVIAGVLAFTRLRHNPIARWLLLGLSAVLLVLLVAFLIVGTFAGSPGEVDVGPAQRVN
jgi:hypothetical protein